MTGKHVAKQRPPGDQQDAWATTSRGLGATAPWTTGRKNDTSLGRHASRASRGSIPENGDALANGDALTTGDALANGDSLTNARGDHNGDTASANGQANRNGHTNGVVRAVESAPAPAAPRVARSRTRRALKILKRTVVTVVLLAILVPVAIGVIALVRGTWEITPILSGSMRPGLAVGGIAITERVPTSSLVPRDVIVFTNPKDKSQLIVHRIIKMVAYESGGTHYWTKGDANTAPDPWNGKDGFLLPDHDIYLVRWTVPLIGYLAIAYDNHRGYVMMGVGVLLFVVAALALRKKREDEPEEVSATASPTPTPAPVAVAAPAPSGAPTPATKRRARHAARDDETPTEPRSPEPHHAPSRRRRAVARAGSPRSW